MENNLFKKITTLLICFMLVAICILFFVFTQNYIEANKDIMTFDETCEYLNLEKEELERLMTSTPYRIPYLKYNDKYVFSKEGLAGWLSRDYYRVN